MSSRTIIRVLNHDTCKYVDIKGTPCSKKIDLDHFCQSHNKITKQLVEYRNCQAAIEFHNKYIYHGMHWEKTDNSGPNNIYHYVSRDRNKKTIEIEEWDYDIEVWIGDQVWPYCGPNGKKRIKRDYPTDFVQQLELEGLIKN